MSNRTITESSKEYNDLQRRLRRFYGRGYNKVLVKLIDEKGWSFAEFARMVGKSIPMVKKEYNRIVKEGGVK